MPSKKNYIYCMYYEILYSRVDFCYNVLMCSIRLSLTKTVTDDINNPDVCLFPRIVYLPVVSI